MSEDAVIMQEHSLYVCYRVKDPLNNIIVCDRNV